MEPVESRKTLLVEETFALDRQDENCAGKFKSLQSNNQGHFVKAKAQLG